MSQSGSSKSIGLQRQLFFALVVQTLIPVVLMLSPFTFALILCIFDINDDVIGGIVVLCIAIYPAIDPLPNIFIIRDYRRALLCKFGALFDLKKIRYLLGCTGCPFPFITFVNKEMTNSNIRLKI